MAKLLVHYDIKTENGVRPVNWEYESRPFPDLTAKILFRRRQFSE